MLLSSDGFTSTFRTLELSLSIKVSFCIKPYLASCPVLETDRASIDCQRQKL